MTSAEEYRKLMEAAEKEGRYADATALREAAEMRDALEALVTKLVKCEPEIAAAFHIRQVFTNAYYTGPTYYEEFSVARRILGRET